MYIYIYIYIYTYGYIDTSIFTLVCTCPFPSMARSIALAMYQSHREVQVSHTLLGFSGSGWLTPFGPPKNGDFQLISRDFQVTSDDFHVISRDFTPCSASKAPSFFRNKEKDDRKLHGRSLGADPESMKKARKTIGKPQEKHRNSIGKASLDDLHWKIPS